MHCYSESSRAYLVVFFLTSLWEVLLLSGITYGWASIEVVFKDKGFFLELCSESKNSSSNIVKDATLKLNRSIVGMGNIYYFDPNESGCNAQNERLNLIFTLAVVLLSCIKFPIGIALDAFGPKVTRTLGCIVYTTACIGLAFVERGYENILFPVFLLLCCGGSLNVLSIYQVCTIVFRDTKSLVLCVLHGAFDSSAVILLIFKLVYENGISLRYTSLFYGALCALTVSITTLFLVPPHSRLRDWNKTPEEIEREVEVMLRKKTKKFSSDSLQGITFVYSGSYDQKQRKMKVYKPSPEQNTTQVKSPRQKYWSPPTKEKKEGNGEKPSFGASRSDSDPLLEDAEEVKNPKVDRFRTPETIWEALLSPAYLLELLYLTVVQLKLWFFVGSMNTYLAILTNNNEKEVSDYTDIFGYIQLCGIVVTPVIGAVFDKSLFYGKSKTQWMSQDGQRIFRMREATLPIIITSFLSLLFCALSLLKSLKVLVACFVFYTIVRGFVYSNHGAYIGITFPSKFFGRLYGLGVFVAGSFGVLQYILFLITTSYCEKDPYWMNLLLLILNIGTTALPIYIYSFSKQAEEHGVLRDRRILLINANPTIPKISGYYST